MCFIENCIAEIADPFGGSCIITQGGEPMIGDDTHRTEIFGPLDAFCTQQLQCWIMGDFHDPPLLLSGERNAVRY